MSPIISGLASVASMLYNAASSSRASSGSAGKGADTSSLPDPSAVVTLSQDAGGLARLAGQGVMASTAQAQAGLLATGGSAGGALQALSSNRAVPKEDFQALLTRFGATDAQKEQLTAGFDTDKDGTITRDEFLQGLAQTAGPQGSGEFAQSLLALLDRGAAGNADGTVGANEFSALTTAFADMSRRPRNIL